MVFREVVYGVMKILNLNKRIVENLDLNINLWNEYNLNKKR